MLIDVVVPTDFSEDAEMALEHAIEYSKRFSAKIHLLHACWLPLSLGGADPSSMPPAFVESMRESARRELAQLQKRPEGLGIPCESHLSDKPPVAAILELAERLPADIIIMGTRGHTGLQHALLGSVAERTVRLAPCPVMTVKAKRG